uniref:Serine/threonine-protein kinase 1 n=1 Tax=Maylandia zebra TaxID=106582 RepID=A0A3P9BNJ0_9CICH
DPALKIAEEMLAYRKVYFLEKYQELEVLGHGGFATVFSGIRIKDSFPVWLLTFAFHRSSDWNGKSTDVPLEVALLIQVGAGPHDTESSITPLLLDWFDLEDELIMHLELTAVFHRECPGVFHRDIKPHNILIETSSEEPRVRYIDFGCGVTFTPGQRIYNSPEWFMYGFCSAEYTTAWQLGVVMYQLLHNKLPFDCEITLWITLTRVFHFCKECRDFLTGCLRKHYKDRFTLEDLRNHIGPQVCIRCQNKKHAQGLGLNLKTVLLS